MLPPQKRRGSSAVVRGDTEILKVLSLHLQLCRLVLEPQRLLKAFSCCFTQAALPFKTDYRSSLSFFPQSSSNTFILHKKINPLLCIVFSDITGEMVEARI